VTQAVTSSNITQFLALIISRLKALESATPKASGVLMWGAAADPMGVDDNDYCNFEHMTDADHRRAEDIKQEIQATHDDTIPTPCVEGIYRCLYQIPLGVEFVSDYHLTGIHEISHFYFDFFAYSQTEGEELTSLPFSSPLPSSTSSFMIIRLGCTMDSLWASPGLHLPQLPLGPMLTPKPATPS